jgi:hypothetical protein
VSKASSKELGKGSAQNVTVAIIGGLASIIVAFVSKYYTHRPNADAVNPPSIPHKSQCTDQVQVFLDAQPIDDYQWTGYAADSTRLNSLVQQFLQGLQQDRSMKYSDAEPFYDALDRAAAMVESDV